jgi:hypothetical protein
MKKISFLLLIVFAFSTTLKAQTKKGFYYAPMNDSKLLLISEGVFEEEKSDTGKDVEAFVDELFTSLNFGCSNSQVAVEMLDAKKLEAALSYFEKDIKKVLAERKNILDKYSKQGYSIYKVKCEKAGSGGPTDLLPQKAYEFYQPGMLAKNNKANNATKTNVTQPLTSAGTLVPYLTKAGKYIFVDSATMKPVLTKPYSKLYPFVNGLARAEEKYYVGFINEKGEEVIPLQYGNVFDYFEHGVAIIYNKGSISMYDKYGLIDRNGKEIIPTTYSSIFYAGNGLFQVQEESQFMYADTKYYINAQGKKIMDKAFAITGHFSEGLAPVRKKEPRTYFYIDTKGNEKITGNFTEAEPFYNGMAAVQIDGKWGFINKSGKLVVDAQYPLVYPYQNNIAVVKDANKFYTFIDKEGNQLFNEKFPYASTFRDGLALVSRDKAFGYINTKGETVIPNKYFYAQPFQKGLALVINDKEKLRFQVINTKGEVVYASKEKFALAAENKGLYKIVSEYGSYFFIDKAGRAYKE